MKTICNISRFIGEIFVFVGKFGLFVYFVLRMLLQYFGKFLPKN